MLAYVSALLLIAGGIAILSRKGERLGRAAAGVVLRTVGGRAAPANAIKGWQHIGAWLAPAEFTFMTMGGVALFASGAGAMRGTLLRIARISRASAPSCSDSRTSTTSISPVRWCPRGSRRTASSGPGPPGWGTLRPASRW
jgi:hypothetical protein